MRIDLTCPVELWHYAMPTPQYPVCRLQLFNLSEQTVASVQAVFTCYDARGETLSRQVERVQGLAGLPRAAFEMAVVVEDGTRASGLDFSIEKVWFEEGTVWRRAPGGASEYAPNALTDARRLDVLRYLAGPDALGYPSDQGAVWVCVCGRPNGAGEESCRRCGRVKRDVFTRFNEATVETILFENENAREEKARRERAEALRRAQEKEAADKKRRRRRRLITGGILGALLLMILAFGTIFHLIPFYRYYTAGQQMNNGVYQPARAAFVTLSAMRGKRSLPVKIPAIGLDIDLLDLRLYASSETLVLECDYRQASESMSTGTITAIRVAQDMFDALGTYRDSATLAKHARYLRAQMLLSSQQYESAIAVLDEIIGYEDALSLRKSAVYQWAKRLMDALDYDAARAKFDTLGAYEDAQTLSRECLYQPAMTAMAAGDYLGAIDRLTLLDGAYRDVAVQSQAAYYGAADQYFAGAQYDLAADYFLLADGYLDSYRRATACLYAPAVALLDEGEYAQAKAMFDKILTYEDAQTLSYECSYRMGLQLTEEARYDEARTLLEEAKAYEPAMELWLESAYLPAVALQEAGNRTGAVALLELIPDYKDAGERLQALRYAEAQEKMSAKDYAAAVALYEALGDYQDSAEELQSARYGYAVKLVEDGEYQQAEERLLALGDYLSSANYLRQARYQMGLQKQEAGDLAGAAALYLLADSYEGARDRYRECRYALAKASLEAGDLSAAAAYLEDISDYQDAAALRDQCVYESAEQAYAAGDLAGAAALFESIWGYQDASARMQACYDAYYSASYNRAKAAMAAENYALAVEALADLARDNPTDAYADIDDIYKEANYRYADQLYEEGKPYEALKYYRNIPDYKDVASKKLDRVCYRMIGTWKSATGIVMTFKEDGTCVIDGRNYYFYARNYTMNTGGAQDDLPTKWTVHYCREKTMSLSNDTARKQYSLTRVTEAQ